MQDYIKIADGHLAKTYNRFPIMLVKGSGTKVWDSDGKEYTDFLAGVAVNLLGHAHPNLAKSISEQAGKLIHCSNFYYNEPQVKYAQKLSEFLPKGISKTFFCNSGTEAVEGAIKLARRATGKTDIIYMKNSFHGRTFGALSATGTARFQDPFKPLVPGFHQVPYQDIDAIKTKITNKTAAIIVEPIQGEGGINIPKKDYLIELRDLCDEQGVLLFFDEVQSGFGRCGYFFASEYFGVVPDIMTMGKAIAGGFPMGAIAAKNEVIDKFVPGDHASTFGGNPLACTAALATLNVIIEEKLIEKSKELGKYFLDKLKKYESSALVKNVRGLGLMLAMELHDESLAKNIVQDGLNGGFLLNQTAKTVLRFVPPLIISKSEIDSLISFLDSYFLK